MGFHGGLTPGDVHDAYEVLSNPESRIWSKQGFGMLRAYVTEELRLHVWDPRIRVEDVSDLHDHPWDFESLVLAGAVANEKFELCPEDQTAFGSTHHRITIKCGEGGGPVNPGHVEEVRLIRTSVDVIPPGGLYKQTREVVHRTRFVPGTVTLVKRRFHRDRDHATVYFELGSNWISAEPKAAEPREVEEILRDSLAP